MSSHKIERILGQEQHQNEGEGTKKDQQAILHSPMQRRSENDLYMVFKVYT